MQRIFAAAALIETAEHVVICRDPTDDKFVELAINGVIAAVFYKTANIPGRL